MLGACSKSLIVALAVVAGACSVANNGKGQTNTAPPAIQGPKKMDITRYKLEDDAFWASNNRGSDKLATQLVGEYRGLLVDAPKRIAIDQRNTFPAAVYYLGRIRDISALPFKRFGLFTAMNVTENQLYITSGQAFEKDDDPIEGPPRDPSTIPEGDMSATESLELRSVMRIPWKPAQYLLTAILRDQISNRAEVELCQSPSCYIDPEVVKYQEAERAKINPPAADPQPGNPLPSYRKLADSLAIPTAAGIEVASARLIDQRRDQPWTIQGAFRLIPTPQELVKTGWSDPYYSQRPADGRPAAVITIWLMLTGANDGSLYLIPLRVPAWTKAGAAYTGYFQFDLRQMRGAPKDAQTYFLYAFSGASMTGPVQSALVGTK